MITPLYIFSVFRSTPDLCPAWTPRGISEYERLISFFLWNTLHRERGSFYQIFANPLPIDCLNSSSLLVQFLLVCPLNLAHFLCHGLTVDAQWKPRHSRSDQGKWDRATLCPSLWPDILRIPQYLSGGNEVCRAISASTKSLEIPWCLSIHVIGHIFLPKVSYTMSHFYFLIIMSDCGIQVTTTMNIYRHNKWVIANDLFVLAEIARDTSINIGEFSQYRATTGHNKGHSVYDPARSNPIYPDVVFTRVEPGNKWRYSVAIFIFIISIIGLFI